MGLSSPGTAIIWYLEFRHLCSYDLVKLNLRVSGKDVVEIDETIVSREQNTTEEGH